MQDPISLTCIIDDDKIYVSLIKKIIESKNLSKNLLLFKNGLEAVEYFEEVAKSNATDKIPQIIFLDLNMPIMDGWTFLDRFTEIDYDFGKMILYVVSSSIDPEDLERAQKISSVSDYLVKPVKIADLKRIFEQSQSQ